MAERPLADLPILVIDCQTTGASPAFGVVLELGFAVVRAASPELDGAEAHWIALPEGHGVPRQVQKITGYKPEFADGALGDVDAWQRLRAAISNAPLAPTAIHYARFELAFLRDWATRFEPQAPFPLDPVCIHAIATRLYPDLPRQTLRALAGFLGHGLDLDRRALGHVEATAFVWRKLVEALSAREITTWEQLQAWLAEKAPKRTKPKKPSYPLAREHYRNLPDAPGVYRFLRRNGDVLYVGKATSLKKRTTSHFQAKSGTPQSPEMLTQVAEIRVTVVPSALEAALLEHDTIRELRPPYNTQLTTEDPRVWYGAPDFLESRPEPDAEHRIGPLPAQSSLHPLGALRALAFGTPTSKLLRSRAVGISDLWTPDEGVFEAGWAILVGKHPDLPSAPMTVARRFLWNRGSRAEDDTEAENKTREWDPERVARHIERAVGTAFQTYRRARWLRLIHDSDIEFREPGSPETRGLSVRDGRIVEGATPAQRVRAPHFDRTKYDRLRILTTELKRIARDGGYVSIGWGKRRIPGRLLAGILRSV
jgi:DNA polymerase-3 subunit epsilon